MFWLSRCSAAIARRKIIEIAWKLDEAKNVAELMEAMRDDE